MSAPAIFHRLLSVSHGYYTYFPSERRLFLPGYMTDFPAYSRICLRCYHRSAPHLRQPPQPNCPPGAVPHPVLIGCGLEARHNEGGISRAAPPRPESRLQSLPPILRTICQNSTPGCSKGSGVFPSRRGYAVSSPRLQFRRILPRDTAQVVTPFVRVGTSPFPMFPSAVDYLFTSPSNRRSSSFPYLRFPEAFILYAISIIRLRYSGFR